MYLAQFFDPEPMMKGKSFVVGLARAGHHVEVVTGFPNYRKGRLYDGYSLKLYQRETMEGLTVHRLPLYPSHDSSSIGRSLNFLSFFISALIYGLFNARRFDVVYVYGTPITVGASAAIFCQFHRKPFILDVRDLWPDSVVSSGMSGTRYIEPVLNALCNFVYRRAEHILAAAKGFVGKMAERGVPLDKMTLVYNCPAESQTIPSGDEDVASLVSPGRFNFLYTGNLGRAQALDVVIRATEIAARSEPNLKLTLIGGGTEFDELAAMITEKNRDNVALLPELPIDKIADVYPRADVLVAHLANDPLFEITIPSKIQFYLAMGKPILVGVKGEAADIVVAANAGVAARPEDSESIAEAMVMLCRSSPEALRAMGQRGRLFYEKNMTEKACLDTTLNILQLTVRSASINSGELS